jgi:glycosyltransferase involved in cell wall biosynthesis
MRIALTVHKLPPESLGGTEVYTRSLARNLAILGHDVAIFHPSATVTETTTRIEPDGVTLWIVPLPASRANEDPVRQFWHTFRDISIEDEFVEFLAKWRPDVVHFQHIQGVSAQLIALAAAVPRFLTLHDYWYFCANSQLIRPDESLCAGPSPGCQNCVDCATARVDLSALRMVRPLVAVPLAYRNRALAQLAEQIDHFFAPSAFLREQYIQQGFPGERIEVLENGMDLSRLEPAMGETTSESDPERERVHFGFLGTLAWQKGVHVLIDAFNQLPEDAASLTIYGSDRAFPEYAARLHRDARHPHIRFGGPVPFDQVGSVLREFDALVVPSLWYENSPLVIQEAYTVGVPVVASRLGALEEKVVEGRGGRLFAPGDAASLATLLRELASEPSLLASYRAHIEPPPTMVAHAQILVERYERGLAARPSMSPRA